MEAPRQQQWRPTFHVQLHLGAAGEDKVRAWHQASLTYQACVLQVGPCRQAGTAVMLITLTALLLAF